VIYYEEINIFKNHKSQQSPHNINQLSYQEKSCSGNLSNIKKEQSPKKKHNKIQRYKNYKTEHV